MIGRIVLVEDVQNEIPSAEVRNGARQTGSTPDEAQEQGSFVVGELLHDLPEPLDQRIGWLNALVGGHGFQQSQRDFRRTTDHRLQLAGGKER